VTSEISNLVWAER